MGKGDPCLPTTHLCGARSNSKETLGVGVQNLGTNILQAYECSPSVLHGSQVLTWGGSGDIALPWALPTTSCSSANFLNASLDRPHLFFCKEVESLVKVVLLCHG